MSRGGGGGGGVAQLGDDLGDQWKDYGLYRQQNLMQTSVLTPLRSPRLRLVLPTKQDRTTNLRRRLLRIRRSPRISKLVSERTQSDQPKRLTLTSLSATTSPGESPSSSPGAPSS
jgi:hypothetical protein